MQVQELVGRDIDCVATCTFEVNGCVCVEASDAASKLSVTFIGSDVVRKYWDFVRSQDFKHGKK